MHRKLLILKKSIIDEINNIYMSIIDYLNIKIQLFCDKHKVCFSSNELGYKLIFFAEYYNNETRCTIPVNLHDAINFQIPEFLELYYPREYDYITNESKDLFDSAYKEWMLILGDVKSFNISCDLVLHIFHSVDNYNFKK